MLCIPKASLEYLSMVIKLSPKNQLQLLQEKLKVEIFNLQLPTYLGQTCFGDY